MFYKEIPVSLDKLIVSGSIELYQSEPYLACEARLLGGQAYFWIYEIKESNEFFLLPIIVRSIENTKYFDALSPYGYPGYLSNSNNLDFISEAFDSYDIESRNRGIVSSFIRMNPIHNFLMLRESRFRKHIIHGQVITIPLNKDYEQIYEGFSSNHRRSLKKLVKLGYKVEIGDRDSLIDFIRIYNETMSRLSASKYYFFDENYYLQLYESGFKIDLFFVNNNQGTRVSGAIFISNGSTIHYHLGGTTAEEVRNSPNKLLFDFVVREYSNQMKWLNLGGGLGNESDSLFLFKKGFGEVFHKFSTLRMVHSPEQYLNLCKAFPKHEVRNFNSFFPLYRKK